MHQRSLVVSGYEVDQEYAHSVGQKKSNLWALYDMHGNVTEWCNDWYDNGYYSNSPSVDPPGPPSGTYRSLRGGTWLNAWPSVNVVLFAAKTTLATVVTMLVFA